VKILQLVVGIILLFLAILLVATSVMTLARWNLLGKEKYFAITLPLLFSILFGRYGFFLLKNALDNKEEKPGTLDEDQLID
jgi:hypothetical protein